MDKIEALEARIHNLEFALTGYISLTSHLLPPDAQESVQILMNDFMESSETFGAFGVHMFGLKSND